MSKVPPPHVPPTRQLATAHLMKRLLRTYVRPYWGRFAAAIFMMLIGAGATAALAKLIQPVLDEVFVQRNATLLYPIGIAVFVTFVAKALSAYGEAVLINTTGQKIIGDIQKELFRHLMKADLAFFQAHPTGTLIARFTTDIALLRYAVASSLTGFGKDILSLIFLIGVMVHQDPWLSLIALVVFPSAFYPIGRLARRMRKVSGNTQAETGQFMTMLEQVFQGVRHVKAYAMEEYEAQRADKLIDRLRSLIARAGRVRSIASPIMEMMGGLAIVTVIVYGGAQVVEGTRTPGSFFSFITAVLLAYEPAKRLANLNVILQEGMAAADRVFALLDEQARITSHPGASELRVSAGEIRFQDVTFQYATQPRPALADFSLTIAPGSKVALVGASGSGKTTALNLIPRFFDVASGTITIDGQDIRTVAIDSLRANIGLVSQEVSLFDDTVRANIAYGRPSASLEEIILAAKRAAAHEFIERLPQGYDTPVGEMGDKLSGGQRQRIAIARAMLKNAPILLLDEATSALDTESERLVQSALSDLMRGRTTLVIAHRLSTIMDADLIYVLQDGQVAEQGTHASLMAQGGLYARLQKAEAQAT
ncbi:ABC transporter ATP-binding protein [Lacibacterium aquatile]|uniref:ABC transporter ATP-binding protein n=1 Tax=Lacibacterium aquatile TaxID=1168082 RepID=A0ABW5DTD0_9PROT